MDSIFIFGHKKPDTDSVTAAISLSYLKNALGEKTEPKVLGAINNETQFVLNHFDVKEPEYLNNVKLQIKDLKYHKDYYLNNKSSIFDCYAYMNLRDTTGVPIVDESNALIGLATIKDISRYIISYASNCLNTSYENILKCLEAEALSCCIDEVAGEVLTGSFQQADENIRLNSETILLVGDRIDIIKEAIRRGVKLIILIDGWTVSKELIAKADKNRVSMMTTKLSAFEATRMLELSNYIGIILKGQKPKCIYATDFVSDFLELTNKYHHTNYPVLDKDGLCLGMVRLNDIANKQQKRVILVDHNEAGQSADGLEEAEIVEIVDHHKLGGLETKAPISFVNRALGSTNSVIYLLYKENDILIPPYIAGLMLSGIISDTLLFSSPTTTEEDKKIAEKLAQTADIDIEAYGLQMLKAGTSLKGFTKEEILYNDFKDFNIANKKVGVGQVNTMNYAEIEAELEDYIALIDETAKKEGYHLMVLFFTDILTNGSYMVYNVAGEETLKGAFNITKLRQGHFLPDIVSRKKQIIPVIMDEMN